MKQKLLNSTLYVFDVNPYIITEDVYEATVIKVQEESYKGFVTMNPDLVDKLTKYNYHLMCVKVPEWAPYVDEEDPQESLTFGIYGSGAENAINQIQVQNADNEVLHHWDAGVDLTFPFQTDVEAGQHCAIECIDDVDLSQGFNVTGMKYLPIAWTDQETGHHWYATNPITDSISIGIGVIQPGATVLNISGENAVGIFKLEVYDHEGTKYDEWYGYQASGQKQLTFPFSTPFVSGDYFKFEWDPSYHPFNQTITGIVFEKQWYDGSTSSWWTQTAGLEETVNMTVNAALDPETSWSDFGATVTIGADDNVFPTLSNPHSVSISYWSSEPSVASIDVETGAIVLNNAGTTMIGATCTEQGYGEYPATYMLTVQAAQPSTWTVTLTGTGLSAETVTIKNGGETVALAESYTVEKDAWFEIFPLQDPSYYTLVSENMQYDTEQGNEHWYVMPSRQGTDTTAIELNYLGAGVNFVTSWGEGEETPENVSQINIGNTSVTGNDLTDPNWTETVRTHPGSSQVQYFVSTGLPTDMEKFEVDFEYQVDGQHVSETHFAYKQTHPGTGEAFYSDAADASGNSVPNPGIWEYNNTPDSGLPYITFTLPSANKNGNAYVDNTNMSIISVVSGS